MTMKACKLRFLSPSDWPEVMDIENLSFAEPWIEIDFRRDVRRANVTCLVAEADCEVVGFAVFERLERNIIVLNMAVHPKYRRSRVGASLIDSIKNRVHSKLKRIIADVSEYNDAGHEFLKSQRFLCTEILPDYFEDAVEPQAAYRFVWEDSDDQ
jgi:ribosomal protein S18 acetylase RimI-like enzyme